MALRSENFLLRRHTKTQEYKVVLLRVHAPELKFSFTRHLKTKQNRKQDKDQNEVNKQSIKISLS